MNIEDRVPEDINKIAPTLAGLEKRNPFVVPENYFENLPGAIQDKISSSNQLPWYETFQQAIAVSRAGLAMLIILLAITAGLFYLDHNRETGRKQLVEQDQRNMEILVEVEEAELVEELIAMNDEHSTDRISESEIENYLIDNHTELNQIMNEL